MKLTFELSITKNNPLECGNVRASIRAEVDEIDLPDPADHDRSSRIIRQKLRSDLEAELLELLGVARRVESRALEIFREETEEVAFDDDGLPF